MFQDINSETLSESSDDRQRMSIYHGVQTGSTESTEYNMLHDYSAYCQVAVYTMRHKNAPFCILYFTVTDFFLSWLS